MPAFLSRDALSYGDNNRMTSTSDFTLRELTAQRFFSYLRGVTLNATEARINGMFTHSVIRYQLTLQRNYGVYIHAVAVPLLARTL